MNFDSIEMLKFVFLLFFVFFSKNFELCRGFSGRIFDGVETNVTNYPWMVSIRLGTVNHLCGGAILSDQFVLTAASCFPSLIIHIQNIFILKAGINQLIDGNEPTEQTRTISRIFLHPNFNFLKGNENNLALVFLSTPLNLNESGISTISLSNLESVENLDLITIGWGFGYQANQSALPKVLQEKIIQENIECKAKNVTNPLTQICADGTCQGDTGGPLMIYSNETFDYELVGLTAFRNECSTEGIFTRLYPFIDWINSTMMNPPPTNAPINITFPPPATLPTPKPDVLGSPIYFRCNTSSTCGCSSKPVIFHDEPPFFPFQRFGQSRIVGGENAEANSWTWIVSLRSFGTHFCGGTILNDQWILTAAHCFPSNTTFGTVVHIGVHNETHISPQIRTIAELIKHPNFELATYINDIALLRLSSPIDFINGENYTGLTCLPPRNVGLNYPQVNKQLAVIGWGRLLHGGIRPQVLRQVRVKVIPNNDRRCLNSIKNVERQFCAMVDGGGKDSCQGDSGGPIHQWLGDRWEQVGIVSFGRGCANDSYPGVYTRLSFFHQWIDTMIYGLTTTTLRATPAAEETFKTTNSMISSTEQHVSRHIECKTTTKRSTSSSSSIEQQTHTKQMKSSMESTIEEQTSTSVISTTSSAMRFVLISKSLILSLLMLVVVAMIDE